MLKIIDGVTPPICFCAVPCPPPAPLPPSCRRWEEEGERARYLSSYPRPPRQVMPLRAPFIFSFHHSLPPSFPPSPFLSLLPFSRRVGLSPFPSLTLFPSLILSLPVFLPFLLSLPTSLSLSLSITVSHSPFSSLSHSFPLSIPSLSIFFSSSPLLLLSLPLSLSHSSSYTLLLPSLCPILSPTHSFSVFPTHSISPFHTFLVFNSVPLPSSL